VNASILKQQIPLGATHDEYAFFLIEKLNAGNRMMQSSNDIDNSRSASCFMVTHGPMLVRQLSMIRKYCLQYDSKRNRQESSKRYSPSQFFAQIPERSRDMITGNVTPLLLVLHTMDAQLGHGLSPQALQSDVVPAFVTNAELAIVDAFESFVYLQNELPVAILKPQHDFALVLKSRKLDEIHCSRRFTSIGRASHVHVHTFR
jgi:hypothetical protein